MKAISPSKSLISLSLLFSIFLSACSSGGNSTANSNNPAEYAADQTYAASSPAMNYNSANSAANSAGGGYYEGEDQKAGAERYAEINENPFLETSHAPLSTFSIDVDTAAYSNVRRFIKDGQLPPKDAVRIEEMINYFNYDYPQPLGDVPFSVSTETASCPWNGKHRLAMIGLQGKKISLDNTPPSNLVFLIDVSGSMNDANKLPYVKQGLKLLTNQLKPNDRVALVAYAGNSGLVLPSTPGSRKQEILGAIDRLESGGSTNGGQGIQLAYQTAQENFIQNGNNRVILATDGDFNVGLTNDNELVSMIEAKRKSGIFLSVFGFGSGNLNDSMMEKLADKGNGNYAYIDSQEETRKAMGEQVAGTLYTIAKDVKIQVEFNPSKVAGYRLLGYENRMLANKDFNDDRKDAGEIGAGHSVTAIYEIVPAGQTVDNDGIELKYSKVQPTDTQFNSELLSVKLRYKEPNSDTSQLLTTGLVDNGQDIANASENLKFAASVAEFGLVLRDSRYKGDANVGSVLSLANLARSNDLNGYRGEFIELVGQSRGLIKSRG
jgi:Ca-activated chloride channel family protein